MAAGRSAARELVSPAAAAPFGAYSQGLVRSCSRLAVVSGQLGVRPDGVVPPDVTAQAEICFAAIAAILAEAGLGLGDVLRFSAWVTRRRDMAAYMAVRDRVVAGIHPRPCSTLMIVSGFTRPEFLVEVEAIAGAP